MWVVGHSAPSDVPLTHIDYGQGIIPPAGPWLDGLSPRLGHHLDPLALHHLTHAPYWLACLLAERLQLIGVTGRQRDEQTAAGLGRKEQHLHLFVQTIEGNVILVGPLVVAGPPREETRSAYLGARQKGNLSKVNRKRTPLWLAIS